jgi:3-methyladenine DNA glycosylase AlkD
MPNPTAQSIIKELKPLGNEGYRNIILRHGVREPLFGVKISDLKKIQKRIKRDYRLALDLYDTGNYDAMYLAGLIADDTQMTKQDLQRWVDGAYCTALGNCTVAWVAAQGRYGYELALKWIEAKKPVVAAAGWSTLGCVVALTDDTQLDLAQLKKLLQRVQKTIHDQSDEVRYAMNGFVIALGSYVASLTADALAAAAKIGVVTVDMGDTACKVPAAAEYIKKVEKHGSLGKKRKTVKC